MKTDNNNHCLKPIDGKQCCGLKENGFCAFENIQCPYSTTIQLKG